MEGAIAATSPSLGLPLPAWFLLNAEMTTLIGFIVTLKKIKK